VQLFKIGIRDGVFATRVIREAWNDRGVLTLVAIFEARVSR
jgi:hypothetical protein